jgi:hypothetical protein
LGADRVSVATAASKRGRSASEASQSSMSFGDLYDTYYRRSRLAHRASQGTINSSLQNGSARGGAIMQDLHVAGVGLALTSGLGNGFTTRTVDRPPPLKRAAAGLRVEETIVEVASPVPTPLVGGGFEGFPSRT